MTQRKKKQDKADLGTGTVGVSITICRSCCSAPAEPPRSTPASPVVRPSASPSPGPLRGWPSPGCRSPSPPGCWSATGRSNASQCGGQRWPRGQCSSLQDKEERRWEVMLQTCLCMLFNVSQHHQTICNDKGAIPLIVLGVLGHYGQCYKSMSRTILWEYWVYIFWACGMKCKFTG